MYQLTRGATSMPMLQTPILVGVSKHNILCRQEHFMQFLAKMFLNLTPNPHTHPKGVGSLKYDFTVKIRILHAITSKYHILQFDHYLSIPIPMWIGIGTHDLSVQIGTFHATPCKEICLSTCSLLLCV